MNSPSESDLTPSLKEVYLYLDYEDQQLVIGALLHHLSSCEFNREAVIDAFPHHDRSATAAVFERMTDRVKAIIDRLR